jgi:hypothetical protein
MRSTIASPRQTGRADFQHPAFTKTLATNQYAGRKPNHPVRIMVTILVDTGKLDEYS